MKSESDSESDVAYSTNTNRREHHENDLYESDLQLAAELGKTLLERNQELENNVRHQHLVIAEKSKEVELLTKQASALREVNDSRLKIYEQLESSIADLERTNQRLQTESSEDKKRIKSLCNSIETLEKKCEELQELADELKKHQFISQKRVLSLDSGFHDDTFSVHQDICVDQEVIKLRASASKLKSQLAREQQEKLDLQTEIEILIQENVHLQYQLQLFQEEVKSSLDIELQTEIANRNDNCPDCQFTLPVIDGEETNENLDCDVEAEEVAEIGECTLVQLRNGVLAYGSQESLLPLSCAMESKIHSSNIHKGVSLLSELDAQYRDLIDKYENILSSHRYTLEETAAQSSDIEGSKSANKIDDETTNNCKLDAKQPGNELTATLHWSSTLPEFSGAKSGIEELSEVGDSSLSSGFSESSERGMIDQQVQTEQLFETGREETAFRKTLDLSSSSNCLNGHFSHSPPEYKRLFEEIFAVLKKSLHSDLEANKQLPLTPSLEEGIQISNEQPKINKLSPTKVSLISQPKSNTVGFNSPHLSAESKLLKNKPLDGKFSRRMEIIGNLNSKSPDCKVSRNPAWLSVQDFFLPKPFSHPTFKARLAGNLTYADVLKKGRHICKTGTYRNKDKP
ncbi:cerebellar degeneration-related protein 2-like [Limulus polyphemus]|uniref:Cerebellar degeneration-related protein 2-like n=1 Tax=Limulus polyphemus TaxID=6850 RepID=A0ABM1S7C1_LIMPO|nr:cerebellar degeneration-related protein 2-like [Limulus polyphemus]